ncbi:MAG TPA: hypothetical protein VH062_33715 [Polyangiaceae bacterium]|jgi:hypothetical protein|nr:hypothetical protein [Polyangiaceae bacterium]
MGKKVDVEINLSEVLVHLRDSGAFRRAVMEVAEQKAPGAEIGNITMKRAGGELPDADLDAVTGGAVASPMGGSIPQVSQIQYAPVGGANVRPGHLTGFADTTW